MSTFTSTHLVALAATLTLAAGLAPIAANATPRLPADAIAGAFFSIADTNGDGKIDAAERDAMRERQFARLDANGDGVISADEVKRAEEQAQRRIAVLTGAAETRFARLDTDGDGKVSHDEFMKANTGAIVLLADTDGDGSISKAEFERVVAALQAAR